ncbi:MAG: DUF2232 domain-containing protein [candidate division Zixibacteria bacterium]|nr:DUF2232 domain-containing protein [candidate division Zixibacteria bacterium]
MLNSDQSKLWLLNLVVLLAGFFVGVIMINALMFLFALTALILLTVRYRYSFAVMACLGSLLVCYVIYGNWTAIYFGLMVLLPGVVMGYKIRTFNSPYAIIGWGIVPYLLPIALLIVYYPQIVEQTPLMIAEMQVMFEENAGSLGLAAGELQMIFESMQNIMEWTIRLAPGILLTMIVSMVFFAYLSAVTVSTYFGAVIPRMKPLYLWKVSEIWLIPLGVALLFVLLDNPGLKIVGENLLVFMVHLFAFFGICLVDFYFKRINIPAPVRLLIYLFILIAVVVAIPILAIVGITDSRFDFRKIARSIENTEVKDKE